MVTLLEIADKLKTFKSVGIISHVRPDGDTIGSALALKYALNKLNIKADTFCDDAIPKKFSYLLGYDGFLTEVKFDYDTFIAVDCADLLRLGTFGEAFSKKAENFVVDHHVSNDRFAKYSYVFDNASNCENMYELIKCLGVEIDEDMANALMTGISTDTGNFAHKNVTENTFFVAGELKRYGADINKVNYYNFKSQSKERSKLFGKVMSKLRFFLDDRLAISSVFQNDLKETGAVAEETEGFIDFVLSINSVEVAISVMEVKARTFKVSFRSKNSDVNEMARVYGGGGHVLASGCMINGEYEDVIDRLSYTVKQYIKE